MSDEDLVLRRKIADVLPRRSGGLTFESDWERRVFGMAVALVELGYFPFDDFRWRVVSAISTWERTNRGREESYRFYERWLFALERIVVEKGMLSKADIDRRAEKDATDAPGA